MKKIEDSLIKPEQKVRKENIESVEDSEKIFTEEQRRKMTEESKWHGLEGFLEKKREKGPLKRL